MLGVIFPSVLRVPGSRNALASMGERAWHQPKWAEGRTLFAAVEIWSSVSKHLAILVVCETLK